MHLTVFDAFYFQFFIIGINSFLLSVGVGALLDNDSLDPNG